MTFNFIHKWFKLKVYASINLWLFLLFMVIHVSTSADDYYWVGGSGLWSDINHWATASGGSVLHNQAPTAANNVIFDQNSFTSDDNLVIINLKNAVCKDMTWQGVTNLPTLFGTDTTSLRIYGSLQLDAGMNFDYNQTIYFESVTGGKTIITAGHTLQCNLVFQGVGGGWTLQDEFRSYYDVTLIHGALSTSGNPFTCGSFISSSGELRAIFLGTSEVIVQFWQINGNNLQLEADQSNFMVGNIMTNQDGGRLVYNHVNFYGSTASLVNSNVKGVFKNVYFENGSVTGNAVIDSLVFSATANISGNDSILYVKIDGAGLIAEGASVIQYLECGEFCTINGNHQIDTLLITGASEINGSNTIGLANLNDVATIRGNNQISHLSVARQGFISGENNFQYALLNGNSFIRGNNTCDTLNFTPGRTYTLGINSILTINQEFNAAGTCYEPIRMLSDTNGVQSTIVKYNGAFESEYLSLRDLNAEGSVPFNAANSVDLGNNTNWTIETTSGKDLYWVNGTGNWSDPDHWDLVSGGTGGHCPPTEIDNAFFDQNSFSETDQTVTIDLISAVCKELNWVNAGFNPTLTGADTNRLFIYGSLYFRQAMENDFEGMVFFEAEEPGQVVVSADQSFLNHVCFTGKGGEWSLKDDFNSSQNIFFQQGGIKTLGNTVNCLTFSSTDTTTRYLNLSTSTVKLHGSMADVWLLNGQNLTFAGDSSLLQSLFQSGRIRTFNAQTNRLVYNDVEFFGASSSLVHQNANCIYNTVKFYSELGSVNGDCKMDSVTFYSASGALYDSDTIGTAIFHGPNAWVDGGSHVIDIAYFYGDATVLGTNTIDTALFYRNAWIEGENLIDTTIIYNQASIQGENIFRTATLLGEGHIFGTNTFTDLTLTKANTYYFEHDQTQTIVDHFKINGGCTGLISLQSDENTKQATLHKMNGGVTGDYLLLRDMKATGNNLPFMATNSVDLGNNQGWEITSGDPKDLYWVNGTGYWSDSLHWSGASGGDGGYCIPTPIDNVFFDQNSFITSQDTVILNLVNATCHNMSWTGATGAPILSGADTLNLRIYGSLTMTENLQSEFFGPVFFEATTAGKSIESKDVQLIGEVVFQGIGGGWTLLDDFSSINNVDLKRGSLNINQKELKCRSFTSDYIFSRQLDVSGATIILTGNNVDAWHLRTNNLQFNGDQSIIISEGNNGLLRTEGGGRLNYNQVLLKGLTSRIYNVNTKVSYNSAIFEKMGSVHGDCNIDSLVFGGSGSVYDSDSINYARFYGPDGNIIGGQHVINTLIFDANGSISGNNSIDTTIIHGRGNVSGTNKINKTLIIGGKATISGQNELGNTELLSNGDISGANHFKSLKLTPGNLYELEENNSQTITDQFQIRGNNCFPITMRSKLQGQQTTVSVPSGKVVSGDFIELRDIQAAGGAIFYAGNFSSDISNNSGWIFSNAPGYIYGFAADTTICEADNAFIGTQNFNPDINTTFLWHDGSTGETYPVKSTDTIAWIKVTYADGCFYSDTIRINRLQSPFIDMGYDVTLCNSDTLFPFQQSENIDYFWNDGTTHPFQVVSTSGNYGVTVTNEFGCTAYDEIWVTVLPVPEVNLGQDTTIRAGDFVQLDAGNPDASFFWSTGETTRTITGFANQTYWVRVEKDGCMASDTISIGEFPSCTLAVPTAFSPNDDGVNDLLYVRGDNFIEFELMIFNRWGEMVFQTKDVSMGWDGRFQGKEQAVDAYNFILRGKCVDGQITSSKGTITLLR